MSSSNTPPKVDCVLDAGAMVGESAIWNGREQRLYWVDILKPTANRFDPATGENEVCIFDQMVGCIGFREQGGYVGAFADDGLCAFDFETGALDPIDNPESVYSLSPSTSVVTSVSPRRSL